MLETDEYHGQSDFADSKPDFDALNEERKVFQAEQGKMQDEARAKLDDPTYLPSHEDVLTAFGGNIGGREFNRYCAEGEAHHYEILNEEFIDTLGNHLAESALRLGASQEQPITILEVGAGSGRLSQFLERALAEKAPGLVRVVATDVPTEQGGFPIRRDFPVEEMPYDEALRKFTPNIVISSWMPPKADWTGDFRAAPSVQEYYLIGNGMDDNVVATPEAWGPDPFDVSDESNTGYARDGFKREPLWDVSEQQIGRNDLTNAQKSRTYAFHRE